MIASFLTLFLGYFSCVVVSIPQTAQKVFAQQNCDVETAYWNSTCLYSEIGLNLTMTINMTYAESFANISIPSKPPMKCTLRVCDFYDNNIIGKRRAGIVCRKVKCHCDPNVYGFEVCEAVREYRKFVKWGCPEWNGNNLTCEVDSSVAAPSAVTCDVVSCPVSI